MAFTLEETVNANAEDVFEYWKNPDNFLLFMDAVKFVKFLTEPTTATAVTRFQLECTGSGRSWVCDVTIFEAKLRISWLTSKALVDHSVSVQMTPLGFGQTAIHQHVDIVDPTRGRWEKRLRASFESDLDRFARHAEKGLLEAKPGIEIIPPFWGKAEENLLPQEGTAADAGLKKAFHHLAEIWVRDTRICSLTAQATAHPAYRQIIALGPKVVPLILRELEREPNWWLAALRALTGKDPALHSTDFDQARASWLAWGKEEGYL